MFVRGAKQEDAQALYTLCCEQAAHALPREIFEAVFFGLLRDSRRRLSVALEDGHIVGYADLQLNLTLARCEMIAVLLDFYVSEPMRGRGIGTGLMISLARQAQSIGCTGSEAGCQRVNVRGQEFLERHGFVRSQHLFSRCLHPSRQMGNSPDEKSR